MTNAVPARPERVSRPGGSTGTALFRVGSVQYQIAVRPFDGDLPAAGERLRHRITATPGYQVTGSVTQVTPSTVSETLPN